MALPLELAGILVVSSVLAVGLLLVAYAIAGHYERRARKRRERRLRNKA